MKTLLIIHHSLGGKTQHLAADVERGARRQPDTVRVVSLAASAVDAATFLAADAVIFGCPEMLGYMSGGLKDLFDRVYDAAQEQVIGKPFAVFVTAGWDGRKAVETIEEIASSLAMRKVATSVIALREEGEAAGPRCEELGETLAAGLDLGIF
jgi:multimeric flavodoxin WrbA